LLQRASWALDSEELENLRQRAEVMGEYDSYNEFRDSYNRALNELYEDSQPVRSSVQKRKKGTETLENTGNNGIIESDILIPRSAGAKARNYDISLPDGGKTHLTEGTRITSVETIAGKGRERQIDVIDYLLDTYGGEELEWQKKKGIGYIDFEGESYRAELHWYEEPTAGRHEWKVKPDADGNWFYDD
jgi:hypothetical protein